MVEALCNAILQTLVYWGGVPLAGFHASTRYSAM